MIFSVFEKKAQGTTEYLVLIGVVVMVSLVVAGLVINQTESNSAIFSKANNLSAIAGDFAATDFSATSGGVLFFVIENHADESITVTALTVNGVTTNYSEGIAYDESASFSLSGVPSCNGNESVYDINFAYTSEAGLSKIFEFGEIVVPCSNEISLITIPATPVVVLPGQSTHSAIFSSDTNFTGGSFGMTHLLGSDTGMAYDGNSKIVQSGNIVGLWHLNDNATDSSSNANNGTWSAGETYITGLWGTQAASFDGSNYISAAQTGLPTGASPRTLSAWFKATTINHAGIITYGNYASSQEFGLQTQDSHLMFWGHSADFQGTATLQPGTWYHAAVTYDGTTVTLYLNGQADGSLELALNTASTDLRIGSGSANEGDYFTGYIEDAAIWDTALSASDVNALYSSLARDSNFISPVYDTGKDSNYISLKYNYSDGSITTYSYGEVISISKETDLATNMIGLWHLNDSLFDTSSYGEQDGEAGGGVGYTSALWSRNALLLDGTDDYAKFPITSAPQLEPTSAITQSVWVKRIPANYTSEIIFAKPNQNPEFWEGDYTSYAHVASNYSYGFITTSEAGALSFVITTDAGGSTTQTADYTIPADSLWHHLAGTYDGSTIKLYFDGDLVSSNPTTGSIYYPNSNVALGIGGAPYSNNEFFHGTIQEASMWSSALSADLIKEIFNKGASRVGVRYRGCANANCGDGSWSTASYAINSTISLTSIQDKRYFQYEILPQVYTFEGSQQSSAAYPKFRDLNLTYINYD